MRLKDTALRVAGALGLGAVARVATRRHLRILGYHGIWVTPGYKFGNCTFIEPSQFEQRMARLKRSGRPVLPLAEAVERLEQGELPASAVVITIDDAWVSTLTHMLPVLEAYELPATLYATTWYSENRLPVVNVAVDYLRQTANRPDIDLWRKVAEIEALPLTDRLPALRQFGARLGVDEAWLEQRQFDIMSPEELAAAQGRGLDIQLHTHRHINVEKNVDALPAEVDENRRFLAEAIGPSRLEHFCYPSGTFHSRAPGLLKDRGIRSATLCDRGLNAPGSDPLALRRYLDGRDVSDAQFDSYLSGLLHVAYGVKGLMPGGLTRKRWDPYAKDRAAAAAWTLLQLV